MADLGCGSGRAVLWNRDLGADVVGIDIAPFFSHDARQQIDLMLADLRQLPFADNTFDKAWSLDVLEHLSPEALDGMLKEAARVLKPGGALFVYTHVRKNAPVAVGLKWINKLARQLERWDLIDLRQERLRKSDHLNPLQDVPHLERVVDAAGFRIERIRYYTPIVGGFVENIMMRMAERAMARRAAARATTRGAGAAEADAEAVREARTAAKERIAASGPTYAALRGLSFAMKLDLLLFGRIRSGPFFALLSEEMRILYSAIDQTVPGTKGGSVHVTAVAEGLAALGHEVHVLVGPGDAPFPAGPVQWIPMQPPLGAHQLRWARSGAVEANRRAAPPRRHHGAVLQFRRRGDRPREGS